MFDYFIYTEKINCPKCRKEISKNDSLQSKVLECVSRKYKQGKPLQKKDLERNFFIKDGWIEAHTICDKCDSYVQFKLIIENGIWTKTKGWK